MEMEFTRVRLLRHRKYRHLPLQTGNSRPIGPKHGIGEGLKAARFEASDQKL